MITLLNTSIITAHGDYRYSEITLDKAKDLLLEAINPMIGDPSRVEGWQSAIGHEATAKIMSTLLVWDIPVNRIEYKQQIGDRAIVFKLNGRPPEGTILTVDEIEKIGYSWGLLERLYVPPVSEKKTIRVDMASFGQTMMIESTLGSLCMGQLSGYEIRFKRDTGTFSFENSRVETWDRITVPAEVWRRMTGKNYFTQEEIEKEVNTLINK